jgi:hypothetical protein
MANKSADSTGAMNEDRAHSNPQAPTISATQRLQDTQLGAPIVQLEGTGSDLGRRESSSLKDIEERVSDILDDAIGKRQMSESEFQARIRDGLILTLFFFFSLSDQGFRHLLPSATIFTLEKGFPTGPEIL